MDISEIVLICCTLFFAISSIYTLHKSNKVIPIGRDVYSEKEING